MNTAEVRRIAEAFISTEDMRGFIPRVSEIVEAPRWPDEVTVIFDLFDGDGRHFDVPIIVIVNKVTGEARFFQSL